MVKLEILFLKEDIFNISFHSKQNLSLLKRIYIPGSKDDRVPHYITIYFKLTNTNSKYKWKEINMMKTNQVALTPKSMFGEVGPI